jgi:ribosomal protein S18 acetylase RimI-like enzyme
MIQIRPAQPEDAPVLAEFGARTFGIAFGPSNTEQDLHDYLASHYGTDIQAKEIIDPDIPTLIAEEEGELIGYAQLRLKSSHPSLYSSSPVELWRIYIESDRKGSGLAHLLMDSVKSEALAHGGDVLWLSVWKENPRAIAFYKKEGFVIVGEKDFWVGADRQFDYVMSLALEPGN